MTASLGFKPLYCAVHLTNGADFFQELTTADGTNWPAGAVINLTFATSPTPTSWPASLTGATATWNVDEDTVLALGYQTRLGAEVTYSDNSGVNITWFIGNVVWHG